LNYKIVLKTVHTPPSPYYIGVHIQGLCNCKEEGRHLKMRQKLETVLKPVEEISNDVYRQLIYMNTIG
jgi:hypothetical protein